MKHPLVSIVIPAYNAERFIGGTLNSALAQTYRRLEILVVDDGSTDGTAGIVRAMAALDNRVRLLSQGNAGVAAARNRGLREARGEFFAPLDADDLWHPRKIELQLETFRTADPDVALVYSWSSIIDEEGRVRGQVSTARPEGHVLPDLVAHNFIGNGSVPLVRTAVARSVGGYDESLRRCEDHKFHLAIAEQWAFAVVPKILVGYRHTNDSLSMNVERLRRSRVVVMNEVRQRHPEIPPWRFRFSQQRSFLWLATKCIEAGRKRDGYRLISLAMWKDPLLPVRHYARSYVRRMLRSWGGAVGLVSRSEPGDRFLPCGPSPSLDDAAVGDGTSVTIPAPRPVAIVERQAYPPAARDRQR